VLYLPFPCGRLLSAAIRLRAAWIAIGAVAVLTHASPADVIPGLFATGSDGAGGVLRDGELDPHYAIRSSSNPNWNGSPFGTVVNQANIPSTWIPNMPAARWISDNARAITPRGPTVVYRLTFDLTGLDASTASISGMAAADDEASILLNGNSIGALPGFSSLQSFGSASGFTPGVNTLDFVVHDTAAVVSGLFISQLSGNAEVPAPGAMLFMGVVLCARRRRR